MNRLLNNLKKCQGRISINLEMKQDLSWFVQFLTKFNGVVMFQDVRHTFNVYVNASLSGMGACWDNNVHAVTRHLSATWNLSITQLEMLNVLIALRTFGKIWANESVVINIDNKAAMYALKYGKIRDPFMQSISRSIWLVAASKDIQMDFVHIVGSNNTKADIMSRVFENNWNHEGMNLFVDYVWWQVNGAWFYQMSLCNFQVWAHVWSTKPTADLVHHQRISQNSGFFSLHLLVSVSNGTCGYYSGLFRVSHTKWFTCSFTH